MSRCVEFLTKLGFGEIIDDCRFDVELINEDDIECFDDLYKENISTLKDEFDDEFILDMFVVYNTIFMRSDFEEMIRQIKKQFDTNMWGTLIQYEWYETGESSVFSLMNNLKIGYFDANLAEVCNKVRSLWVNDYGDDDL